MCIWVCMSVCVNLCLCIYDYMNTCACLWLHLCMFACVYMCSCAGLLSLIRFILHVLRSNLFSCLWAMPNCVRAKEDEVWILTLWYQNVTLFYKDYVILSGNNPTEVLNIFISFRDCECSWIVGIKTLF